jgi:2-oxoglutarate dehydrogenase E1 component
MQPREPWPNASNLSFVEALYDDFLRDPDAVPAEWRAYFERLEPSGARARVGPSFRPSSLFNPSGAPASSTENGHAAAARNGSPLRASEVAALQDRVDQLVRSYRVRGHMIASIDPLNLPRQHFHELDPEYYGFTEHDLDRKFSNSKIQGPATLTLREILDRLRNTYCRSIGVQFMHIDDLAKKNWLQEHMEGAQNRIRLPRGEQLRILTRLTDAVMFEEFVQ